MLFLWVAVPAGFTSIAQSVHVNFSNGTIASYNLTDVRKITFDNDVMHLHLVDGSFYEWNVSVIDYYNYDQSELNVQDWLSMANTWDVSVFPNPTDSRLNVQFNLPLADEVSISLYNSQGKQMLENKLGALPKGVHTEAIDLDYLPRGIYFCRLAGMRHAINKQIVKQ